MAGPKVAPYGSWRSPITSDLIVSESIGLGQIAIDGDDIYWLEMRPAEGGRNVLVRRSPNGRIADVTPPPYDVRTRVHEYGGGAFVVSDGIVYFSNSADQRLYRHRAGSRPHPLTPEVDLRYADGVIDRLRRRMICVREDHTVAEGEVVNTVVSLDLERGGPGEVVVSGNDFYSTPRLSPDGSRLAWLAWDHPNMPWNGSELWVGALRPDGSMGSAQRVAGGPEESIFQPEWSPDGVLYFVSDRTRWWNLYRWRDGQAEPLCEMEAEFGAPQWLFGTSTYAFESVDRIVCAYARMGTWYLASLDTATGHLEPIECPFSDMSRGGVRAAPGFVVFGGGSPTEKVSIVRVELASGRLEVLRRSSDIAIEDGYLSRPQAIEFPTEGDLTAHAWFYPATNRDYAATAGEKPPLLVQSHGGPTGAASTALSLHMQYWTSRGIAVLDVNYGGSTGYGTDYRRRLNGRWGVTDVDDCVNGARYLARRGDVDADRLAHHRRKRGRIHDSGRPHLS